VFLGPSVLRDREVSAAQASLAVPAGTLPPALPSSCSVLSEACRSDGRVSHSSATCRRAWHRFCSALLFSVAVITRVVPCFQALAGFPIWFPYGNMLLSLATFEAARQPGPRSETNKLSGVYCISFRAALSTLNLAAFQSDQNPISGRANPVCFISRLNCARRRKPKLFRVTGAERSALRVFRWLLPKAPLGAGRHSGSVQKAVAGQALHVKVVFLESGAPLIENETNVNHSSFDVLEICRTPLGLSLTT